MRTTILPIFLTTILLVACSSSNSAPPASAPQVAPDPAPKGESSAPSGQTDGQAAPASEHVPPAIAAGDLSIADLAANKDGFAAVVDVRTVREYETGHVPGAINIPLDELANRMSELDAHKGKDLAMICQSGRRSAKATTMLKDAGFEKVHNIEGGTGGWIAAGHEVVTGASPN